jgi:quercetin dioxygenase-like cupin family protein
MTDRVRVLLLCAFAGIVTLPVSQFVSLPAQAELSRRIVHTDPAAFRPSPAVHGGAGTMAFTALLNRGAVTPEFNFLHRGEIPPGAGIGHHFHNTVEEMFMILDGEAQFTIDGRTALLKGPVGVICRTGHSHAIYNSGTKPVQWVNLNVSLNPGVYDNFDLGDTRAGAPLDPIPTFMVGRFDRDLLLRQGGRGRGAAPAQRRQPQLSRAGFSGPLFSRRPGPTWITCLCREEFRQPS